MLTFEKVLEVFQAYLNKITGSDWELTAEETAEIRQRCRAISEMCR